MPMAPQPMAETFALPILRVGYGIVRGLYLDSLNTGTLYMKDAVLITQRRSHVRELQPAFARLA
jgi:hypothetical protein